MIISAGAYFSGPMTSAKHAEAFLRLTETLAPLSTFSVTLTDCDTSHEPYDDDQGAFRDEGTFISDQWARPIIFGSQNTGALYHPSLQRSSPYLDSFVMHSEGASSLSNWAMEGNYSASTDYEAYYERLLGAGPVVAAELSLSISGLSCYLNSPPFKPDEFPVASGAGWALTLGGDLKRYMPATSLRAAGFDLHASGDAITATVTSRLADVLSDTSAYLTRRRIFMSLFPKGFFREA